MDLERPLIARIAGLEAETLLPFRDHVCLGHLETEAEILARLQAARADLVAILYKKLTEFAPGDRRFILAVKRDCFNGRSIAKYSTKPLWQELRRVSRNLCDEILELERERRELRDAFEAIYAQGREEERQHLLSFANDPSLMHGIALGSPHLVSAARRMATGKGRLTRSKARKVERSLLRFVTRAALKLSPFSTLTPIGPGRVEKRSSLWSGLELDGSCRRSEYFRINRSILDQCWAVLLAYQPVRERCGVCLNDTLDEFEPSRFRYFRPGHWFYDPSAETLEFLAASQVEIKLSDGLVENVVRLLDRVETYGELVGQLGDEPPQDVIDRLIELGFIVMLPPWPTHEARLENKLLHLLRSFSHDPELEPALDVLEDVVARAVAYAAAPRPEKAVQELRGRVDDLLESVKRAVGNHSSSNLYRTENRHYFYEDVTISSRDPESPAIVAISRRDVDKILGHAGLLLKFFNLFNHRHDVLHTLHAFWSKKWAERSEVGFLELFFAFRPLWNEYLKFDIKYRHTLMSSFNPMELAAVVELDRLRERIFDKTQGSMIDSSSESRLAINDFAAILDEIPRRYWPLVGPCCFVQPIDDTRWMLNRVFEGTGRYSSRFLAAMEDSVKQHFADVFSARSKIVVDGRDVEFLDLMLTHGSTINLHDPQTPRVLQIPGENIEVEPERRLLLSDLRVQADLEAGSFAVLDPSGRQVLPVHLSSLTNLYMPVMLRFLSVFGPYEIRQISPRPAAREIEGGKFFNRVCFGDLVLRRSRWELDIEGLRQEISSFSDADAFVAIQNWRRRHELPSVLYFYEPIHKKPDGETESYKPQFVDFESPVLVDLFRSVIELKASKIILEEALPSPEDYPVLLNGNHKAIELQLEAVALDMRSFDNESLASGLLQADDVREPCSASV